MNKFCITSLILMILCGSVYAQENYEIQVYGSGTMAKGRTMVELHSNNTLSGTKQISADGELPTQSVQHETIEITHGWTPWFETGFYFFNSIGSNGRTAYVGSHIRPRVAAPKAWNLPIGLSLSTEFGFQKAMFDPNTCTLEIRPIIDKQWTKWYVSFNPTMEKSFSGPDKPNGLIFSPNLKGSYNLSSVTAIGLEYYGSTGPIRQRTNIQAQEHQVFLVTDLNFHPDWEFNAGAGFGLTESTDGCILKLILGRRF